MANEEQLSILMQGVDVWNKWRNENQNIPIDLSKANLTGIDLTKDYTKQAVRKRKDASQELLEENLIFKQFPQWSPKKPIIRPNLRSSSPSIVKEFLFPVDVPFINLNRANLSGVNLDEAILIGASFFDANLSGATLKGTNLRGASLQDADLWRANLSASNLQDADLDHATLGNVILDEANLTGASLVSAKLGGASLRESRLINANLNDANLSSAHLNRADLKGASLWGAMLYNTDLTGADLRKSILSRVLFMKTNVNGAKVSGSWVYGINIWDINGEFEEQKDLIINDIRLKNDEPSITVDNIKVAQFIYLILNNAEIRDAINTLTSKSVLILGRFSIRERKAILDALRNKLREYDLLPIVFDFDRPSDKDFTETIKTLASLSYFVIGDITNPKSSPLELQATVPDYQIPFVPIIQEGESPFAMMVDLQKKYNWVLKTVAYDSLETLMKVLKPLIIDPAMKKRQELRIIKAQEPEVISGKEYVTKGKA